ncbi:Mutator MutT protein (7,8-dihydro-8-oxoguanine-triphosphatase) / Thiazole tautomerase TenI-like domain [hydrothermal vent metagenome]|uniref:8-oxo-dGTP diphosphatase n=1 Tax=hydrothermal vent metagenome TaxID=652676 RepID=A0A3B1BJL9_9ZZZZ
MLSSDYEHVAVAVIFNNQGKVLISQRTKQSHQGGLWEFPGGKLEPGESVQIALARELEEELGIRGGQHAPLIRIPHDYIDKQVLLDVWGVSRFEGRPTGRQGQPLCWVDPLALDSRVFPQANAGIIKALQLPHEYLITGSYKDMADFSMRLQAALARGIRLLQLRAGSADADEYAALVRQAQEVCRPYAAKLLLNTSVEEFAQYQVHGLHLNSERLMACDKRPIAKSKYLCASVHNETELAQANRIDVDFIVLSPVLPTQSHPGAPGLGWDRFYALAEKSRSPVFALGGMDSSLLALAREKGAQGIAAITAFWGP